MNLGLKGFIATLVMVVAILSFLQYDGLYMNIYLLYIILALSMFILTFILESPTSAFLVCSSSILALIVIKKILYLATIAFHNFKILLLMQGIDLILKNIITYAVLFSAFIASYYPWSFLIKKGDFVLDSIRNMKKPRISIQFSKSLIKIVISLLISIFLILFKPISIIEESIYILGVILALTFLILKKITLKMSLASILSWLTLPYFVLSKLVISIPLEESVSTEGVILGKVVAKLTYGKPTNLWLKDKMRVLKPPSWYWKSETGSYIFNPYSQMNYHILIAGGSGTGKSSLAKKLVMELYYHWGIPSLIFDPHNEYVETIKKLDGIIINASKISINPLELDESSPRERIVQVADTLQRVFRLGNLQRAVLEDLLEETYAEKGILNDDIESWKLKPPTFLTLLRVIEKRINYAKSSGEKARYESLKPYVRILATSIFKETTIGFSEILKKPSVIAMANLPGDQIKAILSETILRKIAHHMYVTGEYQGLAQYIVIDEAHRVCRRGVEPSLVARLMMESRKYGIGFIIITQQPLDIDEGIIANSALKVSFKIAEPGNLEYTAKTLAGFMAENRLEALRQALYYMPKYYAIVRDSRLEEPVIIKAKVF